MGLVVVVSIGGVAAIVRMVDLERAWRGVMVVIVSAICFAVCVTTGQPTVTAFISFVVGGVFVAAATASAAVSTGRLVLAVRVPIGGDVLKPAGVICNTGCCFGKGAPAAATSWCGKLEFEVAQLLGVNLGCCKRQEAIAPPSSPLATATGETSAAVAQGRHFPNDEGSGLLCWSRESPGVLGIKNERGGAVLPAVAVRLLVSQVPGPKRRPEGKVILLMLLIALLLVVVEGDAM